MYERIRNPPNTVRTSRSRSRLSIPTTVGHQQSSLPGRLHHSQSALIIHTHPKGTHQNTGPNKSLTSSSPFALKPSSAIFFAYKSNACLYSDGLSSTFAACILDSRWPNVSAVFHHSGRSLCSVAPTMALMEPSIEATMSLLARWRPCQTSEPSAHQRSLSLIHEQG